LNLANEKEMKMASTNPNPDLYPFWAEPEDLRQLTPEEKRVEWKNLFMEQVAEHRKDLKLWLDGDNRVWLGWFRRDGQGVQWIIIRALVQTKTGTLVAVPLRRESTDIVDGVVWSRPWMADRVWEKVVEVYRLIVPPGVF
jgi:hypothetical protein